MEGGGRIDWSRRWRVETGVGDEGWREDRLAAEGGGRID